MSRQSLANKSATLTTTSTYHLADYTVRPYGNDPSRIYNAFLRSGYQTPSTFEFAVQVDQHSRRDSVTHWRQAWRAGAQSTTQGLGLSEPRGLRDCNGVCAVYTQSCT